MKRALFALPVVLVLILGGFFLWGLNPDRDPNAIPSVLIDAQAPEFTLDGIPGLDTPGLAKADLSGADNPLVVNVFASWCVPCRAEHAVLTRMAREENIHLLGINYKDKPEDAVRWLDELGNPYERIGADLTGRVGIEWGISGVPETFVIDANGIVVYRFVGPILSAEDVRDMQEAIALARSRSGAGGTS
ncbi:DsbE family thiol:disulfide interchange protein [Dinoroseobacter sp. PD6]|uniref:DsbE family thiol:disulfide interchange protein n=1 Tax=Dinoroseobacter sp. PD6 TaxID=3028384 RepID=UPI00237A777B|nr:DsbE family thiol:disulfide interchange protein [Dinoroseobacter sp. PD6]MDD9718138.1 DsbE family thiol:disulfide interchange protein [Dinoroseobacter sp. PD6]